MDELTEELLTLGMPVSVFHNEVAPSQYEFSPFFKLTNVASDENTLAMEVMEDLAVTPKITYPYARTRKNDG